MSEERKLDLYDGLLEETVKRIQAPDGNAMEEARNRWNAIAHPLHSLGKLEDMIIPPERILGDRPKVFCLDEDADRFLYNGNYLDRKRTRSDREWVPGDKEQVRMYDSRGVFRALYRYDRGRDRYSAYIMM